MSGMDSWHQGRCPDGCRCGMPWPPPGWQLAHGENPGNKEHAKLVQRADMLRQGWLDRRRG